MDRATLSVERLVAELARYGQLSRARDKGGEQLWRYHYPSLPARDLRLWRVPHARRWFDDGTSRSRCWKATPGSLSAYEVAIHFCLLEDLTSRGPFAPIFRAVGEPERAVDWLGEGQGSDGGEV